MNLQFKRARFELDQGQLLTLDDSLDVTIECAEGALWLTQDGDPRDVTLSAGQSYRIDRTSRVMVFATSPSVFKISSAALATESTAPARATGFLDWLVGVPLARVVAAPRVTALCQG